MNILDDIGNTSLINIDNIYFKLEYLNPSGSIKDRVTLAMIQNALETGKLKPNMTVVEATSGNTGVSVAMVCAALKLKSLIYVPYNTGSVKVRLMLAYGATVHTYSKNIEECISKALIKGKLESYEYLDQFNNKCNIAAQETMAYEARLQYNQAINNTHWSGSYHSVNAIVAGIGTGGTLMGLHKVFPNAEIFTLQVPDKEHIEGICDGIKLPLIPKRLRINTINVTYLQAKLSAKFLAEKYGIHCGISSGANFYAATVIRKKYKKILTVFPDSGDRYL